jgi:hypothetical protein
MPMNNLEAWDIIRSKFMDGGMGVLEYNDTSQYIMAHEDGMILAAGEFTPMELWAIGWYLSAPEDFRYLREWTDGKEEIEVLSSSNVTVSA